MRGKIDVTGVPLDALVRSAYRPSRPQGLGFLHYQPGDLTDDEVKEILNRGPGPTAFSMDYVKGRSIKFHVRRDGDRLYINNRWYDHSDGELRDLLSSVGLSPNLLDEARADQEADEAECLSCALAFLREHGGSYTSPRGEIPKGMDRLELGFYVGSDRGLIKSEWKDHQQTWSLRSEKVE